MSSSLSDAVSFIDDLYGELRPNTERALFMLSDLINRHFSEENLENDKEKSLFAYDYKEMAVKLDIAFDYIFNIKKLTNDIDKYLSGVIEEEEAPKDHK